ncbi:cytochrome oxidase assembly protein ShyY1 [Luteimicrobium subarcticum]|uniref:SURF1-like protein n=2 Tax=Luteimicrobium subarcticum TaxID=620910 RepID=A0A2M8WV97_9MICO|nr:cytochrome oxidase assembly protein ShyY1 [Luteimicrobium subarcticum]
MIGLLVALLALAAVFGALGKWQLDRAYERGHTAQQHTLDQRLADEEAAGPQGLGTVLPPQSTFTNAMVGELVEVSGAYEPDGQVLVPGRALDGRTGYLVVTPLRVTDDGTGGASWADLSGAPVLPVVRGWVAGTDTPTPPVPPAGTVHLTGYLQASEATTADDGLPAGQTRSVSSGALANRWGGPIYAGYLVVRPAADGGGTGAPTVTDAADAPVGVLVALPRPVAEGAGGVNFQSLSYAFQWWLFACFAVFVWWRIVRDHRDSERAAVGLTGGATGEPAEPGRRTAADEGIAGLPARRP